jgi:hypothetical protein
VPTEEEYRAMAAEALARVPEAKSEAERLRLKRQSGAYLKLATHGAEAAARAAAPRPTRIVPEKLPAGRAEPARQSGPIRPR